MKHFFSIAIITLVSYSNLIAQSDIENYSKFPTYPEVLEKFDELYLNLQYPKVFLQFERRPEGWYITETNNWREPQRTQFFWNLEKTAYLKLDYPAPSPYNDTKNEGLNSKSKIHDFEANTYFGYADWYDDVISIFGNKTNLPDKLLYGLARAHGARARSLLYDSFTGHSSSNTFEEIKNGYNSLSQDKVDEYLKHSNLAIENYKKLIQQNPDFKTLVGNIDTKYSNEYSVIFLDLMIFQNYETALEQIRVDGIYNKEIIIASAKNYLNSVAPNGILFTYGDNDTYPLWYVQHHLGVRQDISVINTGLLNRDRYPLALRQAIGQTLPVKQSLPEEFLCNEKSYYIYYGKKETSPNSSLQDFINELSSFEFHHLSRDSVLRINKKKLTLNFPNAKEIEWELTSNKYLTREQYVVMDIILNNHIERPIYFATSLRNFYGLDDYLQLEGMAFRLSSSKKTTRSELGIFNNGSVDIDILSKNILQKFDFSDMQENHGSITQQYDYIFLRLVEAYFKKDDYKNCKKILDYWLTVMPNEKVAFGYPHFNAADTYHKMGFTEIANSILDRIEYNVNNKIGRFENASEYTTSGMLKNSKIFRRLFNKE